MSFSFQVKEELCKIEEKETSCRLAELYGMVLFGQAVELDHLKITTENVLVINRLQQLCAEIPGTGFLMDETSNAYTATMGKEALHRLYRILQMQDGRILTLELNRKLLQPQQNFNAFLRGAVLSGGYFSDPFSGYHFELVTPYYTLAKSTLNILNVHEIPCRMVVRRSNYVVYLKDSQQIYNLLYILGARTAAFDLMNVKIEKETNNNNNRMDNCAAYNMDKALNKAVEQVQAINQIENTIGLSALAEDLVYVALLRKENPTRSLTELSQLCAGRLSKPSLSRKLNKIVEIAKNIKG